MVRPLTVLQMLPALHGGGVERGTLEVAQALVEQGHRSLVMSAGGGMVDELLAHGSEHLCWPVDRKSLWTLRLVRPLRRLLRERSVDILHLRSRAGLGRLAGLARDTGRCASTPRDHGARPVLGECLFARHDAR